MTRMTIKIVLFTCFCLSMTMSFAQVESDLYLFSLERTDKDEFHVHTAKFLSSFNKKGYTNQPSFTPSGDLLVSVRKSNESQNDIWLLNLTTKKNKRLTQTNAKEYSPRIHPDEEHLTVLRQISENPLDQQVCNINLRSGDMDCVPGGTDIGYYTWLSPNELGLFRIDESGNRLNYYNIDDNKNRRITTSIGRTLFSNKSGWLIYVHKFTNDYWYIKKYNPATSVIEIVTQTMGKNEDFAIGPDGTYFMGNDHLLYAFHPDKDKGWKQVADLSLYGIRHITRLAISPDGKKLVLVALKEKS